jgi:transposase
MRALEPEVVDAVWEAVKYLIPVPVDDHPLRCHRPRISDRICFEALLTRLVTGASWVDVETLFGRQVSDTTLRARRDLWVGAGVFARLFDEALAAYDKVIGLDLSEVAIDGSLHKAPGGGEGTGPNPTDRGKSGWKWSVATDAAGIPIGAAVAPANRHDSALLSPTLDALELGGLLEDVETLHLDRGYDSMASRERCAERALYDVVISKRRKSGTAKAKVNAPLGMRWPVERTNSWLSNFGALRRNNDRKIVHRVAQLALAITLILTIKLIDWRDRWNFD